MNGKALNAEEKQFPTMAEVLNKIPKHCFVKDTAKSLMYTAVSPSPSASASPLSRTSPLTLAYLPAWIAYAFVAGTASTGCWVVAHECGHGAFSDNRAIQDTVGYILHSLLLVPYFSWQRSHAVHHSRTNHVMEGETHVPAQVNTPDSDVVFKLRDMLGEGPFTALNLVGVFLLGWPIYLLTGASGGPVRGATNHFNPNAGDQGKHALFPGKWRGKVWQSDVGVVATIAALAAWAVSAGSVWPVAALYLGPYLVCNFWLVLYTWLQHTDVDVPHFEGDDWNLVKGAFMTIDRPYGLCSTFLHHRIGSPTWRTTSTTPSRTITRRRRRGAHGGVPGPVPVRPDAHHDRDAWRGEQVHRGVQAGERVGIHRRAQEACQRTPRNSLGGGGCWRRWRRRSDRARTSRSPSGGRTRRAGTTGEVDKSFRDVVQSSSAIFLRICCRRRAGRRAFAGTPLRWSRRCVRFPCSVFAPYYFVTTATCDSLNPPRR